MSQEDLLKDAELTSAVQMLREIFPDDELDRRQPCGPAAVYTTMVTLWMLTLQRLGRGKSLAATVKDMLAYARDLLPPCRRLREETLSENSGAYSRARTRLEVETVEHFARRVSDSLIDASPRTPDGRRAFIIDGTTVTLAPTEELRAAFPPASNQHGETVWPVAMLLVAHELESGCALPPEVGPMYGEHNTSEAELARRVLARLPAGSVVLADSGFGIFSVAHHAVRAGHAPLLRLTKSRYRSLRRKAELVEQHDGYATHRLRWTPTAKDRKTNPGLPADAAADVLLHQVPLDSGDALHLATTLPIDAQEAGACYARRYDVEHDIRDVKVTLDTGNIRARSVDMFRKELLTSLVAYNLVVQFRRQAARLAGVAPRRLSFTGVWNTFQSFLLHQPPCDARRWRERYEDALRRAARDKLPNRPGRSCPRRAHPRRPKSTKFMKQHATQTTNADESPPEKPK